MAPETTLVLIGGGHAAGKSTISQIISDVISPIAPVEIIELDNYIKEPGTDSGEQGPQRYDFQKVLNDIEGHHEGKRVILVHGLYALYDRSLRSKASMKVFVDCDPDVRLNRMVSQEVLHGRQKLTDVLDLYLSKLRLEFIQYISPTKDTADVLLPSEHPEIGVKLICDGISALLKGEGVHAQIGALYPRADNETLLDLEAEIFDGGKNRFYDLS